jgi:hypothetical protein
VCATEFRRESEGTAPYRLALSAQPLATDRQRLQARRTAQERLDQLGARLDHVLSVVEDQEHPSGSQRVSESLDERVPGAL